MELLVLAVLGAHRLPLLLQLSFQPRYFGHVLHVKINEGPLDAPALQVSRHLAHPPLDP
jgi:hypothetical protein